MTIAPGVPATVSPKRLTIAGLVTLAVVGAGLWSLTRLAPAAADAPEPPAETRTLAGDRVGSRIPATRSAAKEDGFTSEVWPEDALVYELARARAGEGAGAAAVDAAAEGFVRDWAAGANHGPDPLAHEALLQRERRAQIGDSGGGVGPAQVEGPLRLLVVAVEFAGSDTAEDFSHPVSLSDRQCVTETVTYEGPLHNETPRPGARDNNTFWMPSYERDYYEDLIFSTEGVTERARPDLVDPRDGQAGIDLSGLSMANYLTELSGGRVTLDDGPAGIQAWVQLPHSVAYYAANACLEGDAGRVQSRNGLPDNPRWPSGMGTMISDMADAINAAQPEFPWADYDTDGDGLVDHVVLVYAGVSRSSGGGSYGYQQVWAHRGSVDYGQGGYTVDDGGTPDDDADDTKIRGYTAQPENLYLGVLVHEFGHDLGLPDLYDTSGYGRSGVEWWDLMSNGGQTGRLIGTDPAHMSAWSKTALGWADPVVITPTEDAREITLGQASRPPAGSLQAARVDVPPTVIYNTHPLTGSTQAWWAGADQNWADVRLTRDLDLTGVSGPVSLTFDLDYVIETNWDFLFVEISVDGGQTFTQTKGIRLDTGAELTTPEDYNDPHDRLAEYGGLRYGYTGDSEGWLRVGHDLTPYAGQAVELRLRYATDAGFLERGAYVDNLHVAAGDVTVLDDPVESGDTAGWRQTTLSFKTTTPGDGWRLSDGAVRFPRYYLLEWRNADGFDSGLDYTYSTVFSGMTEDGRREWHVDKVPAAVPGLLVWLRDTRFGSDPRGASNSLLSDAKLLSLPSEGPKGGLLLVDSHPQPLRGPRGGSFTNEHGTYAFPPNDNWSGRVQSTNATFSLADTPAITLSVASGSKSPDTTVVTSTAYAPLGAVSAFHDALGTFPGVEALPVPITTFVDDTRQRIKPYTFVDPDASVVVPASGYYPPRTPAGFTGRGAETEPTSSSVSTNETLFLRAGAVALASIGQAGEEDIVGQHTGNPGDHGVHFGFHFVVTEGAEDGSTGTLRVWRQLDAAEVDGELSADDDAILVSAGLVNVGGAYTLTLYSDFDEASALVDGSVTGEAVPVAAPPDEVVRAVRERGAAGLAALAVPADEATAVAWAGPVPSGQPAAFGYSLLPGRLGARVAVVNRAYGPSSDIVALDTHRMSLRTGHRAHLPRLHLER